MSVDKRIVIFTFHIQFRLFSRTSYSQKNFHYASLRINRKIFRPTRSRRALMKRCVECFVDTFFFQYSLDNYCVVNHRHSSKYSHSRSLPSNLRYFLYQPNVARDNRRETIHCFQCVQLTFARATNPCTSAKNPRPARSPRRRPPKSPAGPGWASPATKAAAWRA